MKCRVCGSVLRAVSTDLPFKVHDRSIVIFRELPLQQCQSCTEYMIEDPVMARIDELLASSHSAAEL